MKYCNRQKEKKTGERERKIIFKWDEYKLKKKPYEKKAKQIFTQQYMFTKHNLVKLEITAHRIKKIIYYATMFKEFQINIRAKGLNDFLYCIS